MAKITSRSQVLIDTAAQFVQHVTSTTDVEAENIGILKLNCTREEAERIIKMALTNPTQVNNGWKRFKFISKKEMDMIRSGKVAPVYRAEYYNMFLNKFDVTKVKFSYKWEKAGEYYGPREETRECTFKPVEITPFIYGDGYFPNDKNDVLYDEPIYSLDSDQFVDAAAEGFKFHKITEYDKEYESTDSMKRLNRTITYGTGGIMDTIKEEIGMERDPYGFKVLDKDYKYDDYVFAVPMHVFSYDLGKKIVTIFVNGNKNTISTALVNNPLCSLEQGDNLELLRGKDVKFNPILFFIAAFAGGIPGFIYVVWYLNKWRQMPKKNRKGKKLIRYTVKQLKDLM